MKGISQLVQLLDWTYKEWNKWQPLLYHTWGTHKNKWSCSYNFKILAPQCLHMGTMLWLYDLQCMHHKDLWVKTMYMLHMKLYTYITYLQSTESVMCCLSIISNPVYDHSTAQCSSVYTYFINILIGNYFHNTITHPCRNRAFRPTI